MEFTAMEFRELIVCPEDPILCFLKRKPILFFFLLSSYVPEIAYRNTIPEHKIQ